MFWQVSSRLVGRYLAVLLLPVLSGCQAVRNALEPMYDAAPVAVGAGIGSFLSPFGSIVGAVIGSIYNAAIEMAAIEARVQEQAVKVITKEVYQTNSELWGEWWTTLVPILAIAFAVGWVINKPSDMIKKSKK